MLPSLRRVPASHLHPAGRPQDWSRLRTVVRTVSAIGLGLVTAAAASGAPARGEATRTAAVAATADAPREAIRGVVISCQTWGREWGSDAMVATLQELRDLGVNWVQIHPYGSVSRDGQIALGRLATPDGAAPPWLARPIAEAHRLGLEICITPHLAPWRAGWSWRGDVQFKDGAAWTRFFADYRTWISTLATLCREADGFCVGSELDQTLSGHEQEWREIIAAVRRRTAAPLTYAANWPTYRQVPFWDALDCIAVSAYFPLVDHDRAPAPTELADAWQRIRRDVLRYARTQDRRVVFMELGYDNGTNAARTPWVDGNRAAGGAELQAQCLDQALTAVDQPEDDLLGAFLWKWFPGESRGETFLLSAPLMRRTIDQHWGHFAPSGAGTSTTAPNPTMPGANPAAHTAPASP